MGWSYLYHKPDNVKAYMDGLYSWENDAGRRRVLASAIVHLREYYCAVEHIHPDGTRSVWAGMAILDYPRNCKEDLKFGYKEMDETVGPVHANCPQAILDLLTPTEYKYALAWRERCRQVLSARQQRPRLSDGVVIEVENPPTLNGQSLGRVTVRVINGKRRFYHPAVGLFRWPSFRRYAYRIVPPQPANRSGPSLPQQP